MRKTILSLGTAAALAATVATPAAAAVVLDVPASTGITASPGSRSYSFVSSSGTGSVAFNLEGYLSLDGANSGGYDDIFTVTLNGVTLASGAFSLGGGGNNQVLAGAAPTSVTYNGFFGGGTAAFSINGASFVSGINTLAFSYASAIPQGTGDEGWGLNSLVVNGPGAVPEPAAWALMIGGFGMVGGSLRRRTAGTVPSFA